MTALKRKKPRKSNEDYPNSLRVGNYDNHRSNPTMFSKDGFFFTYKRYLNEAEEFILTLEIREVGSAMPDVNICAWTENRVTGVTKDYRNIFSGRVNEIPEALKPFLVKESDVPEMPKQSTVEFRERQMARQARSNPPEESEEAR